MSTVKIRSLTTTATTTASDDFLVIDGTTNSTRKLSAATPAFLTSVTVPTVATAAGVNLNLATGTAASDKVLIPGTLEATAADGLAASVATLGGASVKKALWVGGIINVAGHTTFEGVTSTGATGTGKLVYDTSPSLTTPALGTPSALVGTNITGTAAGLTAGNVTTNANLTGDVTSVGNATSIAAGVIVNADISASAAIVDTKLDTIATALKVSNSATTAASANTASAIVARDASGNFSAGTISAALTGNASTATALATGRTIAITGDLAYTSPSFDGSGNVTAAGTLASVASAGTSGGSTAIPVVTINAKGLTTSITTAAVIAPAGTLSGNTLASGVTASSLTSLGTIASLTATAGTISTTPSASTDIANKLYVDTVAQGLDAKASCIAATTANITLSGTQTIDGISVIAADRVLVKNQTLSQNNGIYLCAAGAWTRTTDADTWDELTSAFTFIETGTVNADCGFVCTANAGGTLGTTALPWSQFSGAGSYTASTGLTLTGTAFSLTAPVTVALGGTNATSAGIAAFNNITGYTAAGATGTTSTNLVFSTSPTITSPTITGGALNGTLGATTPSTVAATSGTFSGNVGLTNGKLTIASAGNDNGVDLSGSSTNLTSISFVNSNASSIRWNWGIQGGTYATAGTMSLNLSGVGDAITVNGSTRSVSLPAGLNSTAIGATTPSTGAFSTLSATGAISTTATSGSVFSSNVASTAGRYIQLGNTGNNASYFGVENSTANALGANGLTAYDAFIYSSGPGFGVVASGSLRFRVDGNGAAITGTLSATGTISTTTSSITSIVASSSGENAGVYGTTSNHAIKFYTNNSSKFQIDANAATALLSSTGLAVTGALSSTGIASFSGLKAQKTTATSGFIATTDEGANVYNVFSSRNNADSAYLPLNIRGTVTTLQSSTTDIATISSTGVAVTGTITSTGNISVSGNGGFYNSGSAAIGFSSDTTGPGYTYLDIYRLVTVRNTAASYATLGTWSATGLAVTGTLSCTGALSKGSGSFRIEHPLPSKSDTHQLVHSFIEGPKCDLIYRGKVDLVDGKASVNIDTVATMTEGTFEALCRDVQCFTSNESGWGAIRGKVVGNILTIEAQDAGSTDNVSWMVIGERKDKHIMDTDWTDKNGRPIVEPLKPVEPALESK